MRALLLSDTHGLHRELELPRVGCRMVIHTGDFTNSGMEWEVDNFLMWYSELPYQHKLLIAGNHDRYAEKHPEHFKTKCALLGITYLCDESITIDGIKFYGTPYVPTFFDWSFMESERLLAERYALIPNSTQVLLTHGPACYILDEVPRGHVGSTALTQRIAQLPNLRYHMFGHIHESNNDITHNGVRHLNNSCVTPFYNLLKPRVINIRV